MIIGIFFLVIGFIIFYKDSLSLASSSSNTSSLDKSKLNTTTATALEKKEENDGIENSTINKRNGDDFEKFIVQKFKQQYFNIKEWAGDKYVNGMYAETTLQPDLLLSFNMKGQSIAFSVECKWKQNYYKNGIEFASEAQLKRYKAFQQKRNIPVFIAIGVGGSAAIPDALYILPLQEVTTHFISIDSLKRYSKITTSDFFFDPAKQILR